MYILLSDDSIIVLVGLIIIPMLRNKLTRSQLLYYLFLIEFGLSHFLINHL